MTVRPVGEPAQGRACAAAAWLVPADAADLARDAAQAWSQSAWVSRPLAKQLGMAGGPGQLLLTVSANRGPAPPSSGAAQRDEGMGLADRPFLADAPTKANPRRLDHARALSARLGLAGRARGRVLVGVVGSKGKGTAAIYASAVLAAGGLKVGTITGPGITSGIERIRINGESIPEADYAAIGRRIERFAGASAPGTTDLLRGVAPSGRYLLFGLDYLLNAGCHAVVLEAGRGGASDELSVLPLDYLLVTEVFREHTEYLGATAPLIARDKVGAASAATSIIFYLAQSAPVERALRAGARALGATALRVDPACESNPAAWGCQGAVAPAGYGRRNAVLGVSAGWAILRETGRGAPPRARLATTLASVTTPGRLTALRGPDGATLLVDSAVTRDGLVAALFAARKLAGQRPEHIIISLPSDKD
ncbi:MAG: hypothetical protein LBE08_12730, partial [Bifidobacteriaceae bacterium]|nr:hypothetical protein [Bifidobacteriaceae bacterium]